MKRALLSVLTGALFLISSLTGSVYGAITAYVTLSDFACYSSQNSGHAGEIMILHSTSANSMNYDGVAGRLTITGNVTNAAVPLSYTSGYFTCVFNDQVLSQEARGTSTSPINFSTSTSNLSDGATFNITISCVVPDVTPPSPQSAATNTSGNQVTITFDESVEWSYTDVSDFTVKVGGSPVTLTGVSFSGTDAILTLQNTVTSGQAVTVSYNNTSDGLYDDSFNPTASFTDYAVTNNSTAGGSPTITSFSPTSACPGDVVTITGTNFTGATSVSFGGTAATSFSVVSATSITAVVANGTSGSVSVTTAGGTGTKTGFTMNTSIPGTITFNSAMGTQTMVSDGQAGSTDYCGITLNVYGANSGLSALTNAMTYEPNIYPGASGLAANYISNGGSDYIIIKSSSNTVNFSLQSILLIDYGGTNIKIEGFDGATPTGSINYTTNTDPYYFTLDQAGVLTPSIFQNIDEVRISAQSGGTIWIAVNNIQLSNPVVTPTVSSVSVPSNGTYRSGDALNFTVTYSTEVNVVTSGGIPYIPININTGGTVNASYVSGSGSTSLLFRYTVAAGNLDSDGITVGTAITANGGTLKSSGGVDATLTLNSVGSTTGVLIDAVVPAVSSVSSTTANGTYKLGDVILVTVTFSEAVTVTGTPTLSLNSGGTATYSSGSGTTTLVFSYTVGSGQSSADLDYSATNSLSLNSGTIKDAAGNNATLTLPTVGGASSLGGQKNIVISILPTITTQAVTSIAATTATGNGNITDLGFPNPTAYGVCWNTSTNPTTANSKIDNGAASSTGAFIVSMTSLSPNTTYYVRAYATNATGTSYGSEVSFTTSSLNAPVFTSPSSAFDVSNAVYSNKNFNVSSQTSYPYGVAFSSDGSKMFVSGIFNSTVIKYNLSTANDVSTASYIQNFTPVSSGARPLDVALSPDGSKLFCLMQYGTVEEFTLSTPYDLSTASSNYTLTVVSTDYGMDFSSDGTKLYIADRDSKSVYQYNLGTAYDLSTAITPYSKSYSVNSEENLPMDVALSTDGTKMFVVGIGGGKVVEYSLGTAFDVSTAVHAGPAADLSLGAQEANPYGMAFSADGSKLYVIGFTSKVHQYNMKASVSFAENGTGNVTDVDANDGEGGATDTGITYSLTSVDDKDLFNINATSGVITFKSAPDYENPGDSNHDNVYLITVTANDGSTSNNISTLDISVMITDVAENNPPTGASFSTSSGPHQNVVYTFSTSNFGYSDTDSDPLNHIRITAVPANGILYLDADNGDNYDSGEELANNALISKANLDAGNLQYYTTGSASTSFTFDVNDGIDYSASTYTATLNVISKPIVTTTAVTVFNTTSATMGGNVTADGGASVTERGVVYSSSDATPTIAEGATKDTNGTGTGAFSESIGSLSPATTYYIQAYATNSEGTSYGGVVSFTTQKLSQTITFNDLPDKTYGDADFAPDASASSTLTVTYSSSDADVATIVSNQIHIVGAGSCTIYADQPGNGLYSAAPQASKTLTVAKATLTATADNQTKVYGAANPTLTFHYSGWVNGVETIDTPPTVITTVTGTSAADTYTDAITLSGGTDNNYTFNLVAGDFEVTKAVLTATADNQTKVYGEANPVLTLQYSGWVNGVETIDTPPTVVTTVIGTSAADIYSDAITLSGGTDNNYTFNLVAGDFEVTKAVLTATADDQTKAYGASNPTLTFQYSGWVNGVETIETPPSISTTVGDLSGVATYANSIILSGGSDNNYTLNLIPGDFDVTKAILTVTADNQTKVFGAENPNLTFQYSGWINGAETIDTPPSVSTTINETSAVGTYIGAITVSGAVDDKYDFVYVSGDFDVTKSILTVTAHRQVKEYGDPNPSLNFSYSGWVNGIEEIDVPPTIYTNVDFITTAGTYVDAILFFGGSDDHYTFNFVFGTFEVYKATLLVSADKQTRKYGEENPELTYTVSGWKNSDQTDDLITKPVVNTTVAASSGAGTYNDAITVSGAYDVNYVFNYTPADFEVTKATLTVSAESKSKCFDGEVYSGANSATYSGFVAGEDPTNLGGDLNFNGTFATEITPGTYTIIPEGLISQNYDFVYQNGSLVINPLPTATISGDAEICAGSTGMIKVGLTGQAPWSLTYTDGTTSETVTDIYENSYSIGVTIPENTSKTYTITSVTDFNGCSNTAQGSATIKSKSTTSAGEISGDQLIAPGTLPTPIASVKPGSGSGSITYAWESSVDNGLNWEIIPEENGETYAPEVPDQTIWFRRLTISSENNVNCSAVTDPVKINLWPTGVNNQEHSDNVWSAYAVRNTEIRLKADVGSSAIARLYDIQGRLILIKNLEEGSLNIIPTPNIKTGIYMLFIKENERIQGFKIPVNE